MAISTAFNTELQAVSTAAGDSPVKSISFTTDASGYGVLEWSYSYASNVYTVVGGSDLGCEHGACALLEALGFRFYTPLLSKRPASITTGLSATKQSFRMPNNRIWLAYNQSWDDIHASSGTTLAANYTKWATLNACFTDPFPAGHRWAGVITDNAAFFAANPQLTRVMSGSGVTTFALDTLTPGSTDYNNLVELCAAHLLSQTTSWNSANRTHFDPVDGDNNISDHVYPFSKAVVDRVRAGTNPIGTHPARTGRPTASIGVYAYAGHRPPPSQPFGPGVYVLVADSFIPEGYTFAGLVAEYQLLCDFVGSRSYIDTMLWSYSRPHIMYTMKEGYLDTIDAYYDMGIRGINTEFSANWLVNIVGTRAILRRLRYGTGTYTDALNEVMADVFDDDPAVRDLYELWSTTYETYHQWNLEKAFGHVNAMATSWYKTYFKHLLVILYEFLTLPSTKVAHVAPDQTITPGDTYPAKASKLFAHVTAVRDLDITHSYAWLRRLARTVTGGDANAYFYPWLTMYANKTTAQGGYSNLGWTITQRPDWWRNPYLPTDQDFTDYWTALQASVSRDDEQDDPDLVVLNNVPSTISGADATRFSIKGNAEFIFVGPGTVTYSGVAYETDEDGTSIQVPVDPVTEPYGAGKWSIRLQGDYLVSNTGGELFLVYFPDVRKDPITGENPCWGYHPVSADGAFNAYANSNMRIAALVNGVQTTINITPTTDPSVFSGIDPGVFMVENGNTSGTAGIANSNKYLSLKKNTHLVPRSFAAQAFVSTTIINRA